MIVGTKIMAVAGTKAPKWPENFSETVDAYFKISLAKMDLLEEQINQADKEGLLSSLKNVDLALADVQSFGVCKMKMSATASFIVSANSDAHFEFGITPLLIQARSKIVKRLRTLGVSADESEVQIVLGEIRKHKMRFRAAIGVFGFILVLVAIFYLPHELGWTNFTSHQNRLPISLLATVGCTGILWAVLDLDRDRRHLIFGSLAVGALIAAVSLL